MGMKDRRQVIYDIERCICHVPDACRDCSHYPDKNGGPIGCMEDLLSEARELLKEQDSEKKRILKIVWDTLHEGLSIDTVSDQDWVYERIRNRIEGTYPET